MVITQNVKAIAYLHCVDTEECLTTLKFHYHFTSFSITSIDV